MSLRTPVSSGVRTNPGAIADGRSPRPRSSAWIRNRPGDPARANQRPPVMPIGRSDELRAGDVCWRSAIRSGSARRSPRHRQRHRPRPARRHGFRGFHSDRRRHQFRQFRRRARQHAGRVDRHQHRSARAEPWHRRHQLRDPGEHGARRNGPDHRARPGARGWLGVQSEECRGDRGGARHRSAGALRISGVEPHGPAASRPAARRCHHAVERQAILNGQDALDRVERWRRARAEHAGAARRAAADVQAHLEERPPRTERPG